MGGTSVQVWTVGSLLTWTADFFARKGVDEPRLSAELLLGHVLGCTRMALYTRYETVPAEAATAAFKELVKQRTNHVPVAYLIGKAWFFSLELGVTREVLIPRPDTETLVEQVIAQVRARPEWSGESSPRILDMCTGSGAVAVALAKNLATAVVVGADLSVAALGVARGNAEALGVSGRVSFYEGDLFAAVEKVAAPAQFHVVCANPPYIPTDRMADLPAGIRDHEPRLALDGGADGLAVHRRIVAGARGFLVEKGMLIVEIQFDQGAAVKGMFEESGYLENVRVVKDAAGLPRCVAGTKADAGR